MTHKFFQFGERVAGYDIPVMEQAIDPAEQERWHMPDFAKKMGHEQQWK